MNNSLPLVVNRPIVYVTPNERRFDPLFLGYNVKPVKGDPLNRAIHEQLPQDTITLETFRRFNAVLNDRSVKALPKREQVKSVMWALRSVNKIPAVQRLIEEHAQRDNAVVKHFAKISVLGFRKEDDHIAEAAFRTGQIGSLKYQELHFRLNALRRLNLQDTPYGHDAQTLGDFLQIPVRQAQLIANLGDPKDPTSIQDIWYRDSPGEIHVGSIERPSRPMLPPQSHQAEDDDPRITELTVDESLNHENEKLQSQRKAEANAQETARKRAEFAARFSQNQTERDTQSIVREKVLAQQRAQEAAADASRQRSFLGFKWPGQHDQRPQRPVQPQPQTDIPRYTEEHSGNRRSSVYHPPASDPLRAPQQQAATRTHVPHPQYPSYPAYSTPSPDQFTTTGSNRAHRKPKSNEAGSSQSNQAAVRNAAPSSSQATNIPARQAQRPTPPSPEFPPSGNVTALRKIYEQATNPVTQTAGLSAAREERRPMTYRNTLTGEEIETTLTGAELNEFMNRRR